VRARDRVPGQGFRAESEGRAQVYARQLFQYVSCAFAQIFQTAISKHFRAEDEALASSRAREGVAIQESSAPRGSWIATSAFGLLAMTIPSKHSALWFHFVLASISPKSRENETNISPSETKHLAAQIVSH
jgi:hypothetical protein